MYDRESIDLASFQKQPVGAPGFAYQDSWEIRSGYSGAPKGKLPDDLQRELIHGYYASLTYSDTLIGRILDEFDRLDLMKNTIVVLWGDHGWHLGDHGMWCKHTNYEQSTRSPLVISYPGMKQTGMKTDATVGHIDIYPTLLELAGLDVPTTQVLEGTSLVPVLEDPNSQVKKLAISQFSRNDAKIKLMGYTYRGKRYRYTQWLTTDENGQAAGELHAEELYDYSKDPLETRNEATNPEYKEIVERFKSEISDGYKGLISTEECGL